MGYDVFIFSLTILGILAVVVFSYKIFHSRVYPVGMVRKMPTPQEDEMSILPIFESDVDVTGVLLPEGWPNIEITTGLKLSDQVIKYSRMASETSAKYRIISQTGKLKDKTALIYSLRNKYLHGRPEDLALAKEAAEREEALKLRSRIEDMEKRIRELEIKSVQQLQETAEETLQPPQVVH